MSDILRRLKFDLAYLLGNAPWDSGISPPELYDFIASHPPGRALDIGCGTGTNIITLANAGWQVTGFDFSPRAIQLAKRKLVLSNVEGIQNAKIQAELHVDDAAQMKNITNTFDLALDLGCFHGIAKKADYLTQLTRVLAPGGFWLLYGFFKSFPSAGSGQAHQPGPGLTDSDLDLIQRHDLTLVSRKDGWDKRERPSAWFLWKLSDELTSNK
jgi:SAM-dependent methyltransferase